MVEGSSGIPLSRTHSSSISITGFGTRGVELDRSAMGQDYQERLDFLYSRLNYEWLGMPDFPRSSG